MSDVPHDCEPLCISIRTWIDQTIDQTWSSRFGLQEMDNPHAPLVFEKGIRQTNMLEATNSVSTCFQSQTIKTFWDVLGLLYRLQRTFLILNSL